MGTHSIAMSPSLPAIRQSGVELSSAISIRSVVVRTDLDEHLQILIDLLMLCAFLSSDHPVHTLHFRAYVFVSLISEVRSIILFTMLCVQHSSCNICTRSYQHLSHLFPFCPRSSKDTMRCISRFRTMVRECFLRYTINSFLLCCIIDFCATRLWL